LYLQLAPELLEDNVTPDSTSSVCHRNGHVGVVSWSRNNRSGNLS